MPYVYVLCCKINVTCVLLQEQKESIFAKEDQARRDAQDDSDDESAISRTQSELQEVTKVGCKICRYHLKVALLLPVLTIVTVFAVALHLAWH